MGARREDVELRLVLEDPVCARKWVLGYDWAPCQNQTHILIGDGTRRIDLTPKMTDEEAITAALVILYDVEIPRQERERDLLPYLQ